MATTEFDEQQADKGKKLVHAIQPYWPLACLIIVSGLAALAISVGFEKTGMREFMHAYMGVFLIIFAILKLFDLKGFQAGFAKYDLLAKNVPTYGLIYPFLELGLGLAYLAFFQPTLTYVLTIALFSFGAIGVLTALRDGLKISCPCMGNILSVPLSTVTLFEDLAMVLMAALLLLR